MKSSLINHTIVEFQSEEHLELRKRELLDVSDEFFANTSKIGMLRYTISKIWNKTEANKLCFTFEYKDEKSYKQCQKFIEEWYRTTDNSSIPRKAFSNRSVIIADYNSEQN
ncbi:hypothetical protein N9C75_04235 [Alphaproteobacteria bacterium]|nr:hypothetical protein [Alphaproteobacteria bacterium]